MKNPTLELLKQERARRNFMGSSYIPLHKGITMIKIPTFEEYKDLPAYVRYRIRQHMKSLGMQPYHARTGQPSPLTGRPRPNRQGRGTFPIRPHVWKVGPDEERHRKYIAWSRHQKQAIFRGEDHQMSFEDWENSWADNWQYRGRSIDSLVMVRIDDEKAWHVTNVELIDRREHLLRNGARRRLKNS